MTLNPIIKIKLATAGLEAKSTIFFFFIKSVTMFLLHNVLNNNIYEFACHQKKS